MSIITQKIAYPTTEKGTQVGHCFATAIADPYSWLEIDTPKS